MPNVRRRSLVRLDAPVATVEAAARSALGVTGESGGPLTAPLNTGSAEGELVVSIDVDSSGNGAGPRSILTVDAGTDFSLPFFWWAIGPLIATELNWQSCSVVTLLDGVERQRYALSDMILSPPELVSRLSHDMTLLPGDLICCGTSLGVGTIKEPTNSLVIAIDGIGELKTEFRL